MFNSLLSKKFLRKNIVRIVIIIIVLLLIVIAFYLRKRGYISSEVIFNFFELHSILAPLLFIILYSIMQSLFIPTIPLNIGAGFLWGPFWGAVYTIVGFTIGSTLAFSIARYIGGDYFKNRLNFKAWRWILDKVDKNGWKVVAFTRINPIFPAPILSYLFGVTSIRFFEYIWSTFVFILPPCIALAAFGSSIKEFVFVGSIKGFITGIVIAVVATFILFALKPIVKKMFPEKNKH